MSNTITISANKKFYILAAFLTVVALFGVGIYFYYTFESRSLHDAAAQHIQAIAELKISQITQWRKERIANARTTFRSSLLLEVLNDWTIYPNNTVLKQKIIDRLRLIKNEYTFADIFMVNPEGDVLISLDSTTKKLGPKGRRFLAQGRSVEDVIERDFFISSIDSMIYYDIITPLRYSKYQLIGYLVFRTNPKDYLYPLIGRWPIPSRSSEIILVRKEGDSVLYLNNLRFSENAALKFRLPLTRTDLPAVQAASGRQGIYEGNDYRGIHTLAYLAPIPNTPWAMVAKIDYSEIFSELTYRSVIIVIVSVILMLLLAALAVLFYRTHETKLYNALLENEEKYKLLFMHAYDAIFIVDKRGCILDVNPCGCKMLGYEHEELVGRAMNDLYYGIDPTQHPNDVDQADLDDAPIVERLMVRKDGTLVPVEFSRTIMPDGKMQKIIRDITERKRSEELVRTKEEEYQNLLEKMDEGFCLMEFIYDENHNPIDYRYLEVNPAFLKLTGLHDVVGHTLHELVPDYDQVWFQLCAEVARTGVSVRREGPASDKNHYFNVFAYRIGGEGARKVGAVFMDITESKRAEEDLKESKALLAETEHLGKIGGFSLDVRTLEQSWTDEIYAILEYDQSLSQPKLPETIKSILLSPEEEVNEALRRAVELGEPFDREWEIKTYKGNRRWVHVMAQAIREGGRTTRITGFLQDVTERSEAEEALREKERDYQDLVNSMEEGFCIIELLYDKDGKLVDFRFLEINPMFEKQTGLGDAVGKTIRELVPEIENYWFEYYEKVARTGESLRFEAQSKAMHRQFSVFAYRIGDNGKNKIGIIFTETTERKEMEQILRDAQRRQAVEVLSSGMAHDFNNLLSVMMGNVSLSQMQLPSDHPVQKFMAQTMTALERAAELIKQLLAYSGQGKFQEFEIDLTTEIRNYRSRLQASMPPNIEFVAKLPSEPILIKGDPDQIRQIIINLISNARDAIREQQGVITITLSSLHLGNSHLTYFTKTTGAVLTEGEYALLEVHDTGCGMNEEALNHIFDPFYTTKFIGRGLGLSVVLGIVRGHNGGIAVETTLGEGSTFKVILPLIHHHEIAKPIAREEDSLEAPTLTTILLIDDEEMVIESTKDLLESEGYTVIAVSDPREAIEVYRTHQAEIGVVLIDWMMPQMTGGAVAKAIRGINPKAKIIISSGYSEKEVKQQIEDTYVTAFLQKPYTLISLKETLNKVRSQGGNGGTQ